MKKITPALVVPLAIILMALFTKWWYVDVEDGPDSVLIGFPFPYVCDGWHTSLSLQFFVLEFIADALIYFLFCYLCIFLIHRYKPFRPQRIMTATLWVFAALILALGLLMSASKDNIYLVKRDFRMKIRATGYTITLIHKERPENPARY